MILNFPEKDMTEVFSRFAAEEADKRTAEQQLADIELFRNCLAVYKYKHFLELLDEYEKYLLHNKYF